MAGLFGAARPFDNKADETAYLDDLGIQLGSGSSYRGIGIGIVIIAFNLWDRIIDPAHADIAFLWRLGTALIIAPIHTVWLTAPRKNYTLFRALMYAYTLAVPFGVMKAAATLDGGLLNGLAMLIFVYMWLPSVLPNRRDAAIGALLASAVIIGVTIDSTTNRTLIANAVFFTILCSFFAVIVSAKFEAAFRRAWWQEQVATREARTDPLTGAVNRRHFAEAAAAEKDRCYRYGHTGAVILLDLDHFKRVNDSYGHPVGDEALKTVAGACNEEIRGTDLLARLGGEEFAILLPETTLSEAGQLAERLRTRIAALAIETGRGPLHVTASFGVAPLSALSGSWEETVSAADAALYRAKGAGRNQVQIEADLLVLA
ncbi:MAG TPA: GGDEF domain-containing protein [Magnetospirillaceae bacterium]|jgi:diguanylate cyclase (GGDEF)-like protein